MRMQNGQAPPAPGAVLKFGPDQSPAQLIVETFDPVAWAYVDLRTPGQDQRDLQRRKASATLDAAGAPAAAVSVVGARILTAEVAPANLALFATADGTLRYEQHVLVAESSDRAGYSTPADVVPLLAWLQSRPPYVLVVIDRVGADITFSPGGARQGEKITVIGPDDEIERNAPGGWAGLTQGRYQHRAEDSWMHNAKRVAEEVAARSAQVGAQVLVVSGDVRAVQLLSERLPSDPAVLIRHITGSRSLDGSQSTRASHVEHELREASAAQTRMTLDLFHAQLNPGGLAVEGAAATVDALASGRVATLLVCDPPSRDVLAWFGANAQDIYRDPGTAADVGHPVRSAPLVDVAVRSALLSGARVRVVAADAPDAPAEGIGAICRFGTGS